MTKRVKLNSRDERRLIRAWREYRRNIWTPTPDDGSCFMAKIALELDIMCAEATA